MLTHPHSANPAALFKSLFRHKHLIWQMTCREVVGRYRGSILGLLWSFLHPIVMLLVYTFVFSVVLKARWPGTRETRVEFALIVFAGLTVFTFFSELINRSPNLIISNANYVKKVVFPLEVLTFVAAGTALFHTLVSLAILLLANVLLNRSLPWTLLFLPLVLLALVPLCLGLSWLLASLGTFIRDTGQVVSVATQILLFMTPIFYPVTQIPQGLQKYIQLNPLAFVVQETRAIVLYGNVPQWESLGLHTALSLLVAWLGLAWFQKTRDGFANVI